MQDLSYELTKTMLIEEIKKYVMGVTIEPEMAIYRQGLIKRCNSLGLDFEELEEDIKKQIPSKRRYSELVEDTQIDNLDEGLRLAFETLLLGKKSNNSIEVAGLNTRELRGENDIFATRKQFTTENRIRKRMDVLRALCISLKNSTIGYDSKNTPHLKGFLEKKGINSNLNITREQLDYVHMLDLEDLEHFIETVDLQLLPKEL